MSEDLPPVNEDAPQDAADEGPAKSDIDILYGLDDKPALPKAAILALQHVLTMFGATVAVPLLLGPNMGMSAENISVLVSSVMLCSGLATLCQVTIGSRLPIIQGVSFSFLAPFFAIIGYVSSQVQLGAIPAAEQGAVTMQYIAGSVIVGSIFEIIIGFSGLFGLLRKVLTPVVIGPVIMLIGLSLFQHGAPKAGADIPISGLTIVCIIAFSLVLSRKLLVFRLFPILLAVLVAWGLCALLSAAKVFEPAVVLVKTEGLDPEQRRALDGITDLSKRFIAAPAAELEKSLAEEEIRRDAKRAELGALYPKLRTAGEDQKTPLEGQVASVAEALQKLEARVAGLRDLLGRRVGAMAMLAADTREPVERKALADLGLRAFYNTELPAGVTPALTMTTRAPSYVDLSSASRAPLLRVNPADLVLPWGWPRFSLGFIIAVLIAYLASMIESFGDYHACSYMAGGGTPSARQISNGIGSEGLGCLITGLFGGFASTSYSENIGLIGLTKVGSRYVVFIASFLLMGLGLVAKFGAFAATIPGPVVGALYCTLFGLISAVGIQQLAKADLKSDRTLFIAGFSLFMGLSVPTFFLAKTAGLAPGDVMAVYTPTAAESLLSHFPAQVGEVIATVGKSGMGVAAIIGLVLDNLIPGSDAERGIAT